MRSMNISIFKLDRIISETLKHERTDENRMSGKRFDTELNTDLPLTRPHLASTGKGMMLEHLNTNAPSLCSSICIQAISCYGSHRMPVKSFLPTIMCEGVLPNMYRLYIKII